jgi:hypothetical protein
MDYRKNDAMKKAEGIAPVIGLQRSNRFGQVAVNTPPPRRARCTDDIAGKPESVNPLNLRGAGRGKVYGVTAKSQEITRRSSLTSRAIAWRRKIFQT